jgi:hypothetical protein
LPERVRTRVTESHHAQTRHATAVTLKCIAKERHKGILTHMSNLLAQAPQPLNRRGVDNAVVLIVRILGVLILAGFGLSVFIHYKAMNRAYRYNAHVVLQEAWHHYRTHGTITNPRVIPFTNHFRTQNTNYECILGILWQGNTNHLVGITREGITLWLERTNAPEVMEFNRSSVVPNNR